MISIQITTLKFKKKLFHNSEITNFQNSNRVDPVSKVFVNNLSIIVVS